ncbi:MAG TPA: Rieske 2Fe-2S domain-containing protein [Jatrophihabitantaceae bacterium]
MTQVLDTVVVKIERATWLDPIAAAVAKIVKRALPRGPVRDTASGTPLGHPLHPALVAVPVGSWSAAAYLDLAGGKRYRRAARRLIGLGNVAAIPTALTGANDWADTLGAERRVGFVHALVNDVALTFFVSSWWARRRGRPIKGIALSLAGTGVMSAGAWLGGHLAYGLGVGVDTTAFQHAPQEWTDVAAETELVADKPLRTDADGVPIMLLRRGGGIVALADRCTHRGGPLHEGTLDGNTITCPWHGSRFCVDDGSVVEGPATRPAPVFETRVTGGRVEVRRADELRTLRTNPVGV